VTLPPDVPASPYSGQPDEPASEPDSERCKSHLFRPESGIRVVGFVEAFAWPQIY
jgi:hypothetical protein